MVIHMDSLAAGCFKKVLNLENFLSHQYKQMDPFFRHFSCEKKLPLIGPENLIC